MTGKGQSEKKKVWKKLSWRNEKEDVTGEREKGGES